MLSDPFVCQNFNAHVNACEEVAQAPSGEGQEAGNSVGDSDSSGGAGIYGNQGGTALVSYLHLQA